MIATPNVVGIVFNFMKVRRNCRSNSRLRAELIGECSSQTHRRRSALRQRAIVPAKGLSIPAYSLRPKELGHRVRKRRRDRSSASYPIRVSHVSVTGRLIGKEKALDSNTKQKPTGSSPTHSSPKRAIRSSATNGFETAEPSTVFVP